MEGIRGQEIRVILSLKQGRPLLLRINSGMRLSFMPILYYRCCEKYIPPNRNWAHFWRLLKKCNIHFFFTGRGFGHLRVAQSYGIFIEANLNGTVLDTDVIPISDKPIFDSELMWESDKKLLRR